MKPGEAKFKVKIDRNRINVECAAHNGSVLAQSAKELDLNKDGGIFVEAGKAACRYDKKVDGKIPEIEWPEIQARIFFDD